MDESVLDLYRIRHNRLALLKAAGWLMISPPAWVLSWAMIWGLFAVWAYALGSLWYWSPSFQTCTTVAWTGTALLALDGVRFSRRLFARSDHRNSIYYRIGSMDEDLSLEGKSPSKLGDSYELMSDIVFIAPRSLLIAVHSLFNRIRPDEELFRSAEAVVAELPPDGAWVGVERFRNHVEALFLLDRLGIVFHRANKGCVEIRLTPDFLAESSERVGGADNSGFRNA